MTTKIIVIEDTHGIRRLIRMTLEFDGFEVIEATDAQVGLDRIRQEPPDLVLLDVNMPGINGLEACRLLRADSRTSHIPVVMLTMANSPEDVRRGMEAGANMYLTKPFLPTQLLEIVHQLTAHSDDRRGHAAGH